MYTIVELKELRATEREVDYRGGKDTWTLKSYDRLHCIFVHIPKTAGVSIAHALFGDGGGSHIAIGAYRAIFDDVFAEYFKFSFVRNPWDRLVSTYAYLIDGGGGNEYDMEWGRKFAAYGDFGDFVRQWMTRADYAEQFHLKPQYEFICDEDGTVAVDFVGRFERLAEDFAQVRSKLGVECELKQENASRRRDYRAYYDDETRDIVGEVYRRDIELFGYDFE